LWPKGGNFLLNVGPSPDGTLDEEAYKRLEEIGAWMDINGEAIYSSRPIAPYKEGKIAFTQNRHTQDIYAIYLAEEKEALPPEKIVSYSKSNLRSLAVRCTYSDMTKPLKWAKNGTGCVIELPVNKLEGLKNLSAWTIKIEE
jgi:alpha-L-fucosidase